MSEALAIAAVAGGVRVALRVMPRSPRAMIGGVRDGRLVVRVTKPPVDDAANEAVIALIAAALDVPRHAVQIVAGMTSRNKTVLITGIDEPRCRERLRANL